MLLLLGDLLDESALPHLGQFTLPLMLLLCVVNGHHLGLLRAHTRQVGRPSDDHRAILRLAAHVRKVGLINRHNESVLTAILVAQAILWVILVADAKVGHVEVCALVAPLRFLRRPRRRGLLTVVLLDWTSIS